MRISTDQDDPGYGPDIFHVRVWLDDVEQKGCVVTADEEAGYIKRHKRGNDGKYFPAAPGAFTIATEELHGVVRIEIQEPRPAAPGNRRRTKHYANGETH